MRECLCPATRIQQHLRQVAVCVPISRVNANRLFKHFARFLSAFSVQFLFSLFDELFRPQLLFLKRLLCENERFKSMSIVLSQRQFSFSAVGSAEGKENLGKA